MIYYNKLEKSLMSIYKVSRMVYQTDVCELVNKGPTAKWPSSPRSLDDIRFFLATYNKMYNYSQIILCLANAYPYLYIIRG